MKDYFIIKQIYNKFLFICFGLVLVRSCFDIQSITTNQHKLKIHLQAYGSVMACWWWFVDAGLSGVTTIINNKPTPSKNAIARSCYVRLR